MDGSCDVVSLRVSWVVDVSDHGVDVHTPSFKNPPWWERTQFEQSSNQTQYFRQKPAVSRTWVEVMNPVQHQLHTTLHGCVDVGPHHAVGLGANLHGCTQIKVSMNAFLFIYCNLWSGEKEPHNGLWTVKQLRGTDGAVSSFSGRNWCHKGMSNTELMVWSQT